MYDEKALTRKLLFINSNELNIINNEPNAFDDGRLFLSDQDFSNDLDIFGPQSLYHLINRTTTSHGTNQLASALKQPMAGKPDIENYQQAITNLAQQTNTRHLVTAWGLLHGEKEGNLHEIEKWLNTSNELHKAGWVKIVRWLLPTCNIAALLFYWSSDNYIPLGCTIVLSWLCIARFASYISLQHTMLGKKQAILDQYASILKVFSGIQTGSSTLLQKSAKGLIKRFFFHQETFISLWHAGSTNQSSCKYIPEQFDRLRPSMLVCTRRMEVAKQTIFQ